MRRSGDADQDALSEPKRGTMPAPIGKSRANAGYLQQVTNYLTENAPLCRVIIPARRGRP
jgi:hypothetical protein